MIREPLESALVPSKVEVSASDDGVEFVGVLEKPPTDSGALKARGFAVDSGKPENAFAARHGNPASSASQVSVLLPQKSTALLPLAPKRLCGHPTAMELQAILARIEQRLEAVGLSETAAGQLAKKPDAIRNLRRALEKDGRQGISTATLTALAPVLQTNPVWLFAGVGREDQMGVDFSYSDGQGRTVLVQAKSYGAAEQSSVKIVKAIYGGVIEAGSFREVSDFDDIEHAEIFEPCDPDYPGCPLIAFEVRGDSMNALKPRPILEGDRVIALDFEGLKGRVPLRTGMIVVIQQSKDGGHLVERSVKQLEVFEDRYEFHPRSTKKSYKSIVVPHDMDPNDGREVRILGWARRFSNSL